MDITFEQVSNEGERILESEGHRLVREHKDRYRFSLPLIRPTDTVLDCACGSGYGTKILASKAKRTIGLDVSATAVAYSQSTYRQAGLEYHVGNAEALSLPNESIDVYCSFETIEHVANPRAVIREAKRVLREDGSFIVSTPNRVYSNLGPGEKPSNPFHVHEWSLKEFHEELTQAFGHIEYYCQRVKSANKLHPKYLRSKWRRILGMPDLISIDYAEAEALEGSAPWLPMIYLAVCRR